MLFTLTFYFSSAKLKYGACKGYDNLIFLTFGTGNGSGLILDGKLYSGTNGSGGRIETYTFGGNGPLWDLERRDLLKGFVAAEALLS